MTTALEGGEGSGSRPGRSLPPGKTRYPLYSRLGGPQGRSGQVWKISPPLGFYPPTVLPVASRYTDYATRPNGSHSLSGYAVGEKNMFLLLIRTPDLPAPSLVTTPTKPSQHQDCGTIEKGLPSLVPRVLYTCCLHGEGWCSTVCRLSTTAYLTYSNLSSIYGGRLFSFHNVMTSRDDRKPFTYVRVL